MADDTHQPAPSFPTERDVDAVLEEFGGDARRAILALLHDLDLLAAGYEADVSHGFVRGVPPRLGVKRPA